MSARCGGAGDLAGLGSRVRTAVATSNLQQARYLRQGCTCLCVGSRVEADLCADALSVLCTLCAAGMRVLRPLFAGVVLAWLGLAVGPLDGVCVDGGGVEDLEGSKK